MNSVFKLSKATVVGISGVTCGGKTSLTKMLKEMFPWAAIICQDDFYHQESDLIPKLSPELKPALVNWDSIDSLDMISMTNHVRSTIQKLEKDAKSLLIIDGFLIFNYPPLAELCDLKYFITLTYKDCFSRRQNRLYHIPDPPGYFQHCVWPMYRHHLREMQASSYSSHIQYLKGTATLQENFEKILKDLQHLI